MRLIDNNDESPLCKRCRKRVTKLVSLTDDGKGEKMCQKCKKERLGKCYMKKK